MSEREELPPHKCISQHWSENEKELIDAASDHCEVRINCEICGSQVMTYTSPY